MNNIAEIIIELNNSKKIFPEYLSISKDEKYIGTTTDNNLSIYNLNSLNKSFEKNYERKVKAISLGNRIMCMCTDYFTLEIHRYNNGKLDGLLTKLNFEDTINSTAINENDNVIVASGNNIKVYHPYKGEIYNLNNANKIKDVSINKSGKIGILDKDKIRVISDTRIVKKQRINYSINLELQNHNSITLFNNYIIGSIEKSIYIYTTDGHISKIAEMYNKIKSIDYYNDILAVSSENEGLEIYNVTWN